MTLIYPFSSKACLALKKGEIGADKAILGGKGAGLVTMIEAGMNVPPGFTITTEVCNSFAKMGDTPEAESYMLGVVNDAIKEWKKLKTIFKYQPLVSVRSGAPISMPGMMDTILNVGINDDNLDEWRTRIGDRPALDSYRRLIQMLGATAYDIDMKYFDNALAKLKENEDVTEDTDLDAQHISHLIAIYKEVFNSKAGLEFPQDPEQQLSAAIMAVFRSWMNPRAIEYRKINKISADLGTACTVQAMVFGNMGDTSGTGVLFTRDPSTGTTGMFGEYLPNAQGEDVVAGIRTPINVHEMSDGSIVWDTVYDELKAVCAKLEVQYKDMVDLEFTVQEGELFILQSRTGKRSAQAAFKIAFDMVNEGVIDKMTALKRLTPEQLKIVRRPRIDAKFKVKPDYVGLPASPGVVQGVPAFTSAKAVKMADAGQTVILVTHETNPDDIAGMAKAVGILTQTGGATSHAAVVARAMDKACVVGCTDLPLGASKLSGAKKVTIDGSSGKVWIDVDVPVVDSSDNEEVTALMNWSLERMGAVRQEELFQDEITEPYMIMASAWWGDDVAMNLVIDDLKGAKDLSHVSLDITSPSDLHHKDDSVLLGCFGATPKDDFIAELHGILYTVRHDLKGLTLINSNFKPAAQENLKEAGIKLATTQDILDNNIKGAVPAEYAAFSVLGGA